MAVFSSVLCAPVSATPLHGRAKTGLLPFPRRVLRSLCSRGGVLLLSLFLLLLFSSVVLLTRQRWESVDLTPAAAPEEFTHQPHEEELIRPLPVFLRDVTPPLGKLNIYQIVTSSPDSLKGRHYCSLESFCKHNPGSVVWLLLFGQEILVGEQLLVLNQLEQSYPHLQVAQLDLWTVIKDTPLQDIITSGKLGRSKYPENHLSDVLRLGVVYKAGGLYTDFDFICRRSVEDVRNTMALAVPDRVMNGLFHFEPRHPFLNLLLEDAGKHFDGSQWGHNGPLLFTRTAKAFCPKFQFLGDYTSTTKSFEISALLSGLVGLFTGKTRHKRPPLSSKLKHSNSSSSSSSSSPNVIPDSGRQKKEPGSEKACSDVGLLATSEFMPVSQDDIGKMFEEDTTASFTEAVGASRALHLFNRLTGALPVPGGSVIRQVMVQHCPATIGAAAGLGLQL